MIIVLFIALLFATVTDIMDDRITQRGIDAGIAVEGNTYIDKIFGTNKPTYRQRLLVNFAIIFGIAIPGIFLPAVIQPAAIAALIIVGVKHLQGYLAWKKYGAK